MKKPAYKYVHGIECPKCETRTWSRYRHDFRTCQCGSCFVDGGRAYLRYGGTGVADAYPKAVKMRVSLKEYEIAERYEKKTRLIW